MAERAGSQTSGALNREGGPTTFAFEVGNPASLARPVSQGAPVRGGIVTNPRVHLPQLDTAGVARAGARASALAEKDLNALLSFGQAVLGPAIQRRQEEAYWEGVKKAASGSSIQEVLDEQPWYAQIFGDTPMVQGARAYTSQARLDETLAAIANDMPALAKQAPDQVVSAFVSRLDGMMTGDPLTDASLKRAASEKLPLLLRQHAKEHYAYLQLGLRKAQFDSWTPAAATLQGMGQGYAAGTVSEQDFRTAQAQTLAALTPVEGQNEESYRANILAFYQKAAQDGNFHTINLLDQSNFRQFFTPEQQKSLDDQIFRYSQRAKSRWVDQYMATGEAGLQANAQLGLMQPAEIERVARDMNTSFRKATGIDDDVIDVAETVRTGTVSLYRRQEQLLQGQQRTEAIRANTAMAFSIGQGSASYADTGLSKTEADNVFRDLFSQTKDQTKLLVDNATLSSSPFISPSIEGEIRASVRASMTETWNQALSDKYDMWKRLDAYPQGGRATAMAYFGDYDEMFRSMDSLVRNGVPADIAYVQVRDRMGVKDPLLTKENQKAVAEGIRAVNTYDDWRSFFGWAGMRPLSGAGVRALTSILAPKFDSYRQLNPAHDVKNLAVDVAKKAVLSGEVEMYGSWVWQKDRNQPPLADYVGKVKPWANEAIASTIDAKFLAQGINPEDADDINVVRTPDLDGAPSLYVSVIDRDKGHTYVRIAGPELQAAYKLIEQAKARPVRANERNHDVAPTYTRPGTNKGWGGVTR